MVRECHSRSEDCRVAIARTVSACLNTSVLWYMPMVVWSSNLQHSIRAMVCMLAMIGWTVSGSEFARRHKTRPLGLAEIFALSKVADCKHLKA